MFKETKEDIITYSNLQKKEKLQTSAPPAFKYLDSGYLQQAFTIFRSLPISRTSEGLISSSGIIELIKSKGKIETINATLDSSEILSLLEIMYHVPRSVFIKSMSKEPLLGTLTPLAMLSVRQFLVECLIF